MEVVKKEIDQLNAEITIKINETDYKDKVDQSLRNYRKRTNLPGFRKGMVPMGMIKKMVGTNVLVEEINRLLSDKLYNYIGEQKLNILGNPLPKEETDKAIDWEKQKEFDFTYELGLAPEITVSLSEKDKFDKYMIKVSDQMVKEQINEMAKQYGRMIEVELSEEEDMLYGTFTELEKGKIKEDGITNQTVLNIRTISKKGDKKQFIGKKVGETIKVKPQKIAEEHYVASWLGIDKEYIKDQKSEFQFSIEKINRMMPTELNQEFFDKIYGKDVIKSAAEMEERIRGEMQRNFENNSKQLLERDVQDYLLKKAKIQLPDEFMKKWLQTANEKPITKEQIEEEYEEYSVGLKWQLIENKLVKDHNLEVNPEELKGYTINMIRQQFANMGQGMMTDEELQETADRVLKNKDESRRLYDQILRGKLQEMYLQIVKLKEREISYEDFIKLAEKKRKK